MKVKLTVLLILCSCLLLLTQRTLAQETLLEDNEDDGKNTEAVIIEQKNDELRSSLEQPFIDQSATEIPRGEENELNDIESAGKNVNDAVTVVWETTETILKLITENGAELLENDRDTSRSVNAVYSQTSTEVGIDNTAVSKSKDHKSQVGDQRTEHVETSETITTLEQEVTLERNEEENTQSDVLTNKAVFQEEQEEELFGVKNSESEVELQTLENTKDELAEAEDEDSLTENEIEGVFGSKVVTKSEDTETDIESGGPKPSAPKANPSSKSELEVTQIVKSVEQSELQRSNTETQPNITPTECELTSANTLGIEGKEVNDTAANKDTEKGIDETVAEVTTISNHVSVTDITKLEEENEELVTENPEAEEVTEPATEVTEQTTATTTTAPLCTTTGSYAVENDCRTYIVCALSATGDLQRTHTNCPTNQAFNPELQRCSRDLSPCTPDIFHCELEGTYADPRDNTSYYWCVTSRLSVAYHIYHIQCGNGQIYTPELGKCFVDMTNMQNLPLNYELYMSKSPDEECVREEVKVLKAEEKAKLKAAKLREKIQKKYEKELLKKAAKEAKEQAKLQGISLEDEATYACTQDGSYAAATESFYDYYICTGQKKGKFKAIGMKCVQGQNFSATHNKCVGN